MLEEGVKNDPAPAFPGDAANGHAEPGTLPLEQRVRRLEDTVAQLQNTEQLEERVTTRVTERMSRNAPVVHESSGLFGRTFRSLLPVPVTTINPDAPESRPAEGAAGLRKTWTFFDVLADLRSVWRMYVDPRYRLTWVGRLVAPLLLAAILTSWYWVPFASVLHDLVRVLGTLYIKVVDLILAFFLYKALTRESRRYRDQFPDGPTTLPRSS